MDKEYLNDVYQMLYFKELFLKSHKNYNNKENNDKIDNEKDK